MTVKPPNPPYVGPPAHTTQGSNKPIHRIVIHSTVSPCVPGGARATANYFKSKSAGGSAHYVVDPKETVQVAYDSVICWHAPPNENSLGIEMCDIPSETSGLRWAKPNQLRMLHRTARLTARLCAAYNVPVRFLTVSDLLHQRHGITTHNNVSHAFHQSTHWDPGKWPQRAFMAMVRTEYKKLTKGAKR